MACSPPAYYFSVCRAWYHPYFKYFAILGMDMKNKTILLVVVSNLVILIVLAITLPQFMISPGKPIDAHAELAEDCFSCHTPFLGSSPEKCISCHKVSEIGLKTTKGLAIDKEKKNVAFHQKLLEEDCIACHSDHKGVKAFRPISQFSHSLLEPTLEKQCDSCHVNPGDALHLNMKENCSQCHDQTDWSSATFDHKQYFLFDRHHPEQCERCHIDNDYKNYTCYGCHEHSRSNIRGEHIEEGIYDYENCVECHRSGDEDEAEYLWKMRRFNSGMQRPFKFKKHHDDDDDDD